MHSQTSVVLWKFAICFDLDWINPQLYVIKQKKPLDLNMETMILLFLGYEQSAWSLGDAYEKIMGFGASLISATACV